MNVRKKEIARKIDAEKSKYDSVWKKGIKQLFVYCINCLNLKYNRFKKNEKYPGLTRSARFAI